MDTITDADEFCLDCGEWLHLCKCPEDEVEPDQKSEEEYKYEMVELTEHLDKRVKQGDLDVVYYSDAHISLLKRRVKQLITEVNFYKNKSKR